MNITIRRADSKDYEVFDTMYGLLNDLHAETLPEIFQSVPVHLHTREFYSELMDDPHSVLFIAECDGQPAGFVLMKMRTNSEAPMMTSRWYAVVDSIFVQPEFRRQGLGEMLMMNGEEWAEAQGAESLDLNVYEFNTAARRLYEKLGYQTLSRKLLKHL